MTGAPAEIAVLIGTRPEAVKLAPVIRELEDRGATCQVVVTGQHREMLDPVLSELGIEPDHRLQVLKPGQGLGPLAAALLSELVRFLEASPPQWLIVQGDTSSAAMGALAAFYSKVAVAHIEAGLRTQDAGNPFPEEMNRRLIADLATLHFAPTSTASENLQREGIDAARIHIVGNTTVDTLRYARSQHFQDAEMDLTQRTSRGMGKQQVLVTCHRRESIESDLAEICLGIRAIVEKLAERVEVVFPMHRNPEVRSVIQRQLGEVAGVRLIEPLGYLDTIAALCQSRVVITDSGGVLEEAATLGVPTLVVRRACERPEAFAAGVALLTTPKRDVICETAVRLLTDNEEHRRMAVETDVFGDGHAGERIVDVLLQQTTPAK